MKSALFLFPIALIAGQALALFLEPDCGLSPMQLKIINGRNAEMESSPWMAYLHTATHFVCAGSLISHCGFSHYILYNIPISRYKELSSISGWILTAAHCITSDIVLMARLGEFNRDIKAKDCRGERCPEEYPIDLAVRNRQYDQEEHFNDIGMFRTERRVEYKVHIRPACILLNPQMLEPVESLTWFTTTGWGRTSAHGFSSRILQTLDIKRRDRDECSKMFSRTLARNQICVGNNDSNTCNGDSGGPMGRQLLYQNTLRYVQLGIASFTNAQCHHLSVMTDVVSHIVWIQMAVTRHGRDGEGQIVQLDDQLPPFYGSL
ncbi:hypothetical protein KR009_006689 [Drosophila setifemur]|nr:hypothetical protein KR009_006689 [Drosophila setifemur]